MVLAVVSAGCGPGGPGASELASTDVFTTAMPGATEVSAGGSDPYYAFTKGQYHGRAWRMFGTEADEDEVVAWYRATYEAQGWQRDDRHVWTVLQDGHLTEFGWRKGDLRIAVGFPSVRLLTGIRPGFIPRVEGHSTIYETIIFYRPPETGE